VSAKTADAKLAGFLELLAQGYSATRACRELDIGRSTVYGLRDSDEEFARQWGDAEQAGVDELEDEARRRAVDGVERPVTIAGEAETVREYSDQLLVVLLKAKRPGVYRERFKHEHVGPGGGPVVVEERIDTRPVLKVLADVGLLTRAAANGAGDSEAH